jgi:hypothetical protein
VSFANELGTAIGVYLEMEVGHDLELHDSMTCSAAGLPCVAHSPAQRELELFDIYPVTTQTARAGRTKGQGGHLRLEPSTARDGSTVCR